MENRKSLRELGETYEKDIATLTEQIAACREKFQNSCGTERIECGRRLACLYEMRRDAKIMADRLKHYYDSDTKKRAYHKTNIF